jgi:hypothetical protein
MFLEYEAYKKMGGTLDLSAYTMYSRDAEYKIRAQAAGQTGERLDRIISAQGGVPQTVKDCIFKLVSLLSAPCNSGVTSESQSQGGQSESIHYVSKSASEIDDECDEVIRSYLTAGGLGNVLYRGAEYAE